MKRLIPFLIAALSLSSCLKEDNTKCPAMYMRFEMEDEFLGGDFDSRIKNDVLLYIFNDDKLVYSETIPYKKIAGGARYAIEKKPGLVGNLKFVAWAVKSGERQLGLNDPLTVHHVERNPAYIAGCDYKALYIAHTKSVGRRGLYDPHHPERYLGTHEPLGKETLDGDSKYDIIMTPAPGRIKVNISDPNGYLGDDSYVEIEGGMSHMKLGNPRLGRTGREGYGTRADVQSGLRLIPASTRAEGDPTHTTDVFGVLPTEDNAELKVHIMKGDKIVETLKIRSDNTGGSFKALDSGDYLVFDYVLNAAQFRINICPFDILIVDSDL